MQNRSGRAFRGMMMAVLPLALAACRDRKPPPGGQPPATPAAAVAGVDLTMRLPDQPPWNDDDTLTVTIQNGGTAAVPDAVLELFVAAPVAARVDSSAASRPEAAVDAAGTRLRFAIGPVAGGQTIEVRQAIRTPPAPAPPAAAPPPGQPAPPRPAPGTPAARSDTTTRFAIRATLLRRDGTRLAAAEDTLRIRPESAVTVGGCGNVTDVVASRYGVGPVRVGMPVDALRNACPEARDTTWKGQEGTMETGLIAIPGGHRVVAVTAGGTVQRIVIDQPGLKTPAGVGVGAQVADLRSRFGRMCAGRGEGVVAVWFPNAPGISFGLDTAATKGWTPARIDPDSVPDTVAVGSMWIRRGSDDCPAGPGESTR